MVSFLLGEPIDTKVEIFFSSLKRLDERLEALGIVETNGVMTYLDDDEAQRV